MAASEHVELKPSSAPDGTSADTEVSTPSAVPASPVLCSHCKRTAENGLRCLGMCVADSDY